MSSNIPRRILRRRSPPRIVMVDGGKGENTPQRKIKELVHQRPPQVIETIRPVSKPKLANIIVLRKEDQNSIPISQLTTVNSLSENETVQRMRVPRKSSQLKRKGLADDNASNAESQTPLKSTNLPMSGHEIKDIGSKKVIAGSLFDSNLQLGPGITHVWHLKGDGLPSSASVDECPSIEVNGDQGLRFTFHHGAGSLIQDIDLPPHAQPSQIRLPPGTQIFTVSTLGGQSHISPNTPSSFASITSTHSTENRCGVGFQRDSSLTQVGMFTFLCRGGVLNSSANNSNNTMKKKSLFRAGDITEEQNLLTLTLPANILSIVVISSTKEGHDEDVAVSISGVSAKSAATSIQRKGMVAHLWSVIGEKNDGTIQIAAQTGDSTSIHSIVGFVSNSDSILSELSEGSWLNLVEEGPLSSNGRTSLGWLPAPEIVVQDSAQKSPQTSLQSESELISTEPILESVEPKTQLDEQAEVDEGIFTLPDALGTEVYEMDLSGFADDLDEDDVLTFSKQEGAHWLNISPSGQISGTPSNDDAGRNIFVFRVSDLEGASSDATMVINVIEKKLNRAPFWKMELSDSTDRPNWSKTAPSSKEMQPSPPSIKGGEVGGEGGEVPKPKIGISEGDQPPTNSTSTDKEDGRKNRRRRRR